MKPYGEIAKDARARYVPVLMEDTEEELLELVRDIQPHRILEIGTAIGYSGLIMLKSAPPDCILDTVELLERRAVEATENFTKFGIIDRVNLYQGDVEDLLDDIIKDRVYDLVYIDGPKSKYLEHFRKIEPHLSDKGAVFCDNVLFRGMVASGEYPKHKFRTIVMNMRAFLSTVESDTRYELVVKQKGDGIAVIRKSK